MDTKLNIKWYKNKKWIGLIVAAVVLVAGAVTAFLLTRKADAPSAGSVTATSTGSVEIPLAINPIDKTAIPLGDGKISNEPKAGYVYSCQTSFNGGGANDVNSWIDTVNSTWDATKKVAVSGEVSWPNASYQVNLSGDTRSIVANNLPINGQTTGVYPIESSDPAYQYDRNPNEISEQSIDIGLPANPTAAGSPNCVGMGAIGILQDGVVLFNALDDGGRDAAAYETLDSCDGHPQMDDEYHHHDAPSCIVSQYTKASTSTLIGYAYDGYGIYVERDVNGDMLTNENLDECHGRTSAVQWDGKSVEMYHYVATVEYPYVVGCYHGTSAVTQAVSSNMSQRTPPHEH